MSPHRQGHARWSLTTSFCSDFDAGSSRSPLPLLRILGSEADAQEDPQPVPSPSVVSLVSTCAMGHEYGRAVDRKGGGPGSALQGGARLPVARSPGLRVPPPPGAPTGLRGTRSWPQDATHSPRARKPGGPAPALPPLPRLAPRPRPSSDGGAAPGNGALAALRSGQPDVCLGRL